MLIPCIEILLLLAISMVCDIKTRKIKNFITYTFIAAGIFTNVVIYWLKGFVFSLTGICISIILLFFFYALRMLGAGDVKLFAAVGAIAGGRFAFYSIIYSFLFGGIAGIIILAFRKNAAERYKNLLAYIKSCYLTRKLMEYEDSKTGNGSGRFPFTYAAVPGTLAQLMLTLSGIQVVKTWI